MVAFVPRVFMYLDQDHRWTTYISPMHNMGIGRNHVGQGRGIERKNEHRLFHFHDAQEASNLSITNFFFSSVWGSKSSGNMCACQCM